jgi:DNA-binding NtrC family response regulator
MPSRVAFVDDDLQFLRSARLWQNAHGLPELATAEPQELVQWVKDGIVDIAVSDLRMAGISGVEVLERVSEASPTVRKILLTGFDPSKEEKKRLDKANVLQFRKPEVASLLDSFIESDDETEISADSEAADQVLDLQARVEELEAIHRAWAVDLIEDLEAIEDQDGRIIGGAFNGATVAEVVTDIRDITPRGMEYIKLWRGAMSTLRRLGRKA